MKTLTVTNKKSLLEHRSAIATLFSSSFDGRDLGSVWDWAYIDNPNGEPIVTLCYDNDSLVGHYAVVPFPLSNAMGQKKSYLSMTTMIAQTHRNIGLFTQLALANYQVAEKHEVDFIFGFPNTQSSPGFRKRLNWLMPEVDYVATLDKATLAVAIKAGAFDKKNLLGINMNDSTMRAWRLSRPGGEYQYNHGLAFKRQKDSVDVLWWESPTSLLNLPDDLMINILVKTGYGFEENLAFNYQFGGIGIRTVFDSSLINREMAISDLF